MNYKLLQWQKSKKIHQNTVLLIKTNDSYECCEDDAKILNKILHLKIVWYKKDENQKLPTSNDIFPYVSFKSDLIDFYVPRLIKAGHKVTVLEQVN